jgi:HdeA/HdeB family
MRAALCAGLGAAAMLAASASLSSAQVRLHAYYLNVKALTCAQLANTYQEDADFLGVWCSGWYNGRLKSHFINPVRTKQGIREVIVYCKANPDKKVVDAVDAFVKKVRANAQ